MGTPGMIGSVIGLVFVVLMANLLIIIRRFKRDFPKGSRTAVLEDKEATILRDREIQRRLEREQADAEFYVARRNKTLELYAQVRMNAAAREREASWDKEAVSRLQPPVTAPDSDDVQ